MTTAPQDGDDNPLASGSSKAAFLSRCGLWTHPRPCISACPPWLSWLTVSWCGRASCGPCLCVGARFVAQVAPASHDPHTCIGACPPAFARAALPKGLQEHYSARSLCLFAPASCGEGGCQAVQVTCCRLAFSPLSSPRQCPPHTSNPHLPTHPHFQPWHAHTLAPTPPVCLPAPTQLQARISGIGG